MKTAVGHRLWLVFGERNQPHVRDVRWKARRAGILPPLDSYPWRRLYWRYDHAERAAARDGVVRVLETRVYSVLPGLDPGPLPPDWPVDGDEIQAVWQVGPFFYLTREAALKRSEKAPHAEVHALRVEPWRELSPGCRIWSR